MKNFRWKAQLNYSGVTFSGEMEVPDSWRKTHVKRAVRSWYDKEFGKDPYDDLGIIKVQELNFCSLGKVIHADIQDIEGIEG